jgi:putative spermidine/putrescine transport system permease protein
MTGSAATGNVAPGAAAGGVAATPLRSRGRGRGAGVVRGWLEAWGPALPLLVVVGGLLLAPAIQLIVGSFLRDGALTIDNWIDVLTSPRHQHEITGTLFLAVVSASVATLIGTPLAWLIARMPAFRRSSWLALLNVAANIGGIGLGFALVATIGSVGMITLALRGFGIGWSPPPVDSFEGLILGFAYTNIPLFVILTLPAFGILRDDWAEAARVSAATRPQYWRRIGLPILSPFIAAGWLLIFTWSIGIYSLAYALAGTGGNQRVPLITLRIGTVIQSDVFTTWRASVLAVILMVIALIALWCYRTLLRRGARWF